MSKIQTVWVYADAAERYADLIAGARRGECCCAVRKLRC